MLLLLSVIMQRDIFDLADVLFSGMACSGLCCTQ